jgi:hypothetical protein
MLIEPFPALNPTVIIRPIAVPTVKEMNAVRTSTFSYSKKFNFGRKFNNNKQGAHNT